MHRAIGLAAALTIAATLAPAQQPLEPAKGRFLVAARQVLDPNFSQTVVLLFDYNEDGAMGVIVNRPTKVKLMRLLPEVASLKDRPDVAYLGGPVETSGLRMLVRSRAAPQDGTQILDGIYLTTDADLIETTAEAHLRGYAGYAGWAPGQLDNEIERGDWHIFEGDQRTVFSARPESVWRQLMDRTQMQFARLVAAKNGAVRLAFR